MRFPFFFLFQHSPLFSIPSFHIGGKGSGKLRRRSVRMWKTWKTNLRNSHLISDSTSNFPFPVKVPTKPAAAGDVCRSSLLKAVFKFEKSKLFPHRENSTLIRARDFVRILAFLPRRGNDSISLLTGFSTPLCAQKPSFPRFPHFCDFFYQKLGLSPDSRRHQVQSDSAIFHSFRSPFFRQPFAGSPSAGHLANDSRIAI